LQAVVEVLAVAVAAAVSLKGQLILSQEEPDLQ
jgi:hypothetical protein